MNLPNPPEKELCFGLHVFVGQVRWVLRSRLRGVAGWVSCGRVLIAGDMRIPGPGDRPGWTVGDAGHLVVERGRGQGAEGVRRGVECPQPGERGRGRARGPPSTTSRS